MYKKAIFVLLILAAFSMFGACRIVDASTLVTGTPVHMGNAAFKVTTVNVKKGDKLDLIDDVAVEHIITNGYWKGSTPVTKQEPGAPKVLAQVTGGSQAVGPFTTAGKYMLYCTIHGGMQVEVVVS
ncbi:MAG TPA: hypothetical protein DHW02_07770 [Ktedonobacter sp.]|nr:hypothetical protein [Ktedonobacter sp.]